MPRIVATSDIHGHLPNIPPCDILFLGGDLCPDGSDSEQKEWLDSSFRSWLETVPAKEIVGIAGNHDFIFARNPSLVPKNLRWHYLQDQIIELFDLKIYGSPWQLPFFGVFNIGEAEMEKKYASLPQNLDIFLNHGPPFRIRDEIPNHLLPFDTSLDSPPLHTGSVKLREAIFRAKPRYTIFGHIHSRFGMTIEEGLTFLNVSLLNNEMEVVHHPVILDIEKISITA